jgi:hypothetical protein
MITPRLSYHRVRLIEFQLRLIVIACNLGTRCGGWRIGFPSAFRVTRDERIQEAGATFASGLNQG